MNRTFNKGTYHLWGFETFKNSVSATRAHKYHIIPANPLPLVISFAILNLALVITSNLHLILKSSGINASIFKIILFYHKLVNSTPFIYASVEELSSLLQKNFFFGFFYQNLHLTVQFEHTSIYINWVSAFLIALGVFFLWSSTAVEEGSESRISSKVFSKLNLYLTAISHVGPNFHTNLVRKGFKLGFILFIVSEVMFFFGFFWAFFHSALSPTIQIGGIWPPVGVEFITVRGFAVANTVILLTSGATLTLAHHAFELIPQKRSTLLKEDLSWIETSNKVLVPEGWVIRNEEGHPSINRSPAPKKRFFFLGRLINWVKLENYFSEFYLYSPIWIRAWTIYLDFFARSLDRFRTEISVRHRINLMMNLTLLLAFLFMMFQGVEYFICPVSLDSGVYGSTFFMITGLHGAHVFIGTCFLIYCKYAVSFWRLPTMLIFLIEALALKIKNLTLFSGEKTYVNNTTSIGQLCMLEHVDLWHYGEEGLESFDCAAWYWHFVDVVWIFVFSFVYVWSHLSVLDKV